VTDASTPAVPGFLSRLRLLAIGVVAGAALVWGLRPPVAPAPAGPAMNAPVAPAAPAAAPAAAAVAPAAPAPGSVPPALAAPVGSSTPVAVVDGQPITLRALEDSLLKQEGVLQLMDMLESQFKETDWAKLDDRAVVVQTNSWRLTRVQLAAQLLKQKASEAREDLIGISLAEQALRREGVVVDDAVIEAELKRMEKRHYEGLESRGKPYIDFRTFIEQTQKMPLEQYKRQEGFRMGAGIRVLVERRAAKELSDEQLRAYFDEHQGRYRVQEAADISDIYIAFQTHKNAEGKDVVAPAEKERLMGVMHQLHQAVLKRQVSFERTFLTFGRSFDQHADANGHLGWVNRDGSRPLKGSRRISRRAMDEVFAAQPPYPVLLAPVAGEGGIDLILVHSRRAGKEPVFEELRLRLVADIVDGEIAPRTKRVLDDLRRAAVIDYRSLPALIEGRVKDAGLPGLTAQPAQDDPAAPAP
jgi:hypothetical protein